jgi:hypothetical protein
MFLHHTQNPGPTYPFTGDVRHVYLLGANVSRQIHKNHSQNRNHQRSLGLTNKGLLDTEGKGLAVSYMLPDQTKSIDSRPR